MLTRLAIFLGVAVVSCALALGQETHSHAAPEQLGKVSFPVSCRPSVQKDFNRGIALLHSFAYGEAEQQFRSVAELDPRCAMAHWGIAMTKFHQLWQPPIAPREFLPAHNEVQQGLRMGVPTEREKGFLRAADLIFLANADIDYPTRALRYEEAMAALAAANPEDPETQIFYALALLANASPADQSHVRQKKAAQILEPLFQSMPAHPGIAHYLIHACDNAEMASSGLPAARLYARVAPSAPHALHMPSHIFTRLGLWEDSIASNSAAREAAHRAGDLGEELHAMDYLVYAYLQLGREAEAKRIVDQMKSMPSTNIEDFKVAYAATAMPVRYAAERGMWAEAASVPIPAGAPAEVRAIAIWSQGIGLARSAQIDEARTRVDELESNAGKLAGPARDYWARQSEILRLELSAWIALAAQKNEDAVSLMRRAADDEDSLEKLPVTPGPIVPAREQLGEILLKLGRNHAAICEFQTSLKLAPGRRGGAVGLRQALKATEPN